MPTHRLQEQAQRFPKSPGVYLFKDRRSAVLYVGKAKNLHARIQSYLEGKDSRSQIAFLLRRAQTLEYIVTDTEKEALLLENTLIKEHQPRYNVHLRDDKSYVSIRIGMEHPSPGILPTRRILKDGANYFGPYASSTAAREVIDQLTRFFRIRSCTDSEFANRIRPCLKFDIGRCSAPCVGYVPADVYAEQVREAAMFLKGKTGELSRHLTQKMRKASSARHYEDAARFRDALRMIAETVERQKVVIHGGGDYDAVGLAREFGRVAICLLIVRHGTLLDRRAYQLGEVGGGDRELLASFLLAHYVGGTEIPSMILMPLALEGASALVEILSERRDAKVLVGVPRKGLKYEMVSLAAHNAREAVRESAAKGERVANLLDRLGKKLQLGTKPSVIECVDISNLSGREAVGSLVCFIDGEPEKRRYRTYNIRTLSTPDDYGMMREVLLRRFGKALHVDRKGVVAAPPDLLLVDGGKGQLGIACRALAEIGVTGLSVAAIAKGESQDKIFLPERMNPVSFKRNEPQLLYLMRIRDEAHRFGISAHRRRRSKKMFTRIS